MPRWATVRMECSEEHRSNLELAKGTRRKMTKAMEKGRGCRTGAARERGLTQLRDATITLTLVSLVMSPSPPALGTPQPQSQLNQQD